MEVNDQYIQNAMPCRVNLHIHSTFSDGQYTPEALVLQAIKKGINVIGISDHYDTSKTMSISPGELKTYIEELNRISTRHKNRIRLMKGIEINSLDLFIQKRELPPSDLLEQLDFVLLEYISNIPRYGIPLMHAALLAQDVPVPAGLAHTDLDAAFPGLTPGECVDKLVASGLFLELNEAYCRTGETFPFFHHYRPYLQTKNARLLRFSAGTDTHGAIIRPADDAVQFLSEFDLAGNLFFSTHKQI
jgi:histidinol phosphatase-like PHP family hydrolase